MCGPYRELDFQGLWRWWLSSGELQNGGLSERGCRMTRQKRIGIAALDGIDEILTVTPLGLPTALARLYQHHRACHGHGAARMPEREAMALGLDGDGAGPRPPCRKRAEASDD